MTFADALADINEWHFFQEFVYSKNTFRPTPKGEVELADNIIYLGDLLFAFQLKERVVVSETTALVERKWFENKVLGKATSQIRDTVKYLKENHSIALTNHRGHKRHLKFCEVTRFHKLVVYLPNMQLPQDCMKTKYHMSQSAGFIHIIPAHDYLSIVRILLTPVEVAAYLDFREELIESWKEQATELPELSIVGQYLQGEYSSAPSFSNIQYLNTLDHRAEEWDMSGIISNFPNRITSGGLESNYYPIVLELAALMRNELREFKRRFRLSIEKSKTDEFTLPYRIAIPRTNCGFVFIPLAKEMLPNRQIALFNLTVAHKYDQRLSKCIGVSIGNHKDGWFDTDWCYLESPWQYEENLDALLANNFPFRAVNVVDLPRYTYRTDNNR